MTMNVAQPPLARRSQPPATIADWLAIPEEKRAELIHGRIIYHAMPGPTHGIAQSGIAAAVRSHFHRRAGDADRPGGWWISQEVDMEIGGIGCRPDLVGWLREEHPKVPQPDATGLVTVAPAWICEVLSRSTAATDVGPKRDAYYRAGVAWYWLADPANRTLTALRRTEQGYIVAFAAGSGERVRVAPFAAVEIDLAEVFDDGEETAPGE
jgi:Uma2 family endonuclease